MEPNGTRIFIIITKTFTFLAYFPCFEKIKVGLYDHHAVCLCNPQLTFQCLNQFYETWYVYHGT
jgi:hypothetical protein